MSIIVVDINGTPHEISDGTNPEYDVLARKSGEHHLVLASNDGDLFNPLDISNKIRKPDRERGGPFWRLVRWSQ